MPEVRWVRRALANLDEETDYIAQDDPVAAAQMLELLCNAAQRLGSFPEMGRVGRIPGTREFIVAETSYIIPYRVRNNVVEILRVFHTARNWPKRI